MTQLATMPDMKWKVHCYDAKDSWWYRYTFSTKKKTVTWYDLANGMTGGGNWSSSGGAFYVNWWSGTKETWGPIDTAGWHGQTRMNGKPYTLDAEPIDYFEVPTQVFLSDEAFIKATYSASQLVQTADLHFRAWVAGVTIAYSNAWDNHQKILKDISATQQLAQDLLLGFALAFVGGAAGGLVGGLMRKAAAQDYTIDALKDLTKYGVRGPMGAALSQRPAGSMPASPTGWRAEMEKDITTELAWVSTQIVTWRTTAQEQGSNWERDFDPEAVVRDVLRITTIDGVINMLVPPPRVAEDQLRTQFERGWITAWIERFGQTVTTIPIARELVTTKLYNYAKAVGVPNVDAFIEKHIPTTDYREP